MTVKELIAKLQTMPQEAIVIYDFCSDYSKMDEDDITLMEPTDGDGIIDHYGHIMFLKKNWRQDAHTVKGFEWEKQTGRAPEGVPSSDPKLLTAVHFPGN